MTDTPNLEWDHWQLAWRSEPPAVATAPTRTAELQRRLRHHRLAWAYTVFDVLAANALFAIAAYFVLRAPTLPVLANRFPTTHLSRSRSDHPQIGGDSHREHRFAVSYDGALGLGARTAR